MLHKHSSKSTDNNTKPMAKQKLINQQNISFQVQIMIATKGKVPKQHSRCIDFDDVFNDIGCFEGIFSLQLKLDTKPYQAPPR